MKILLCDDERTDVVDWVEDINDVVGSGSAATIELDDFRAAIRQLEERRHSAASGGDWTSGGPEHLFDNVDILILDYDLTFLDRDTFITGEAIAYLARCFSYCGLIVGLNQFKAGFDLTLAGHPESYADVNVPSTQIGNPGLWGSERSGFRPWMWPELLNEVERFRTRADEIGPLLDVPILSHLGLAQIAETIPRSVLEYLEGDKPALDTTFREFVLGSEHGFRTDGVLPDVVAARIAAARIYGWFNQVLLPVQEVLVDAPHLIARVPGLMNGLGPDAWMELVQLGGDSDLSMMAALFEARYPSGVWCDRCCWYWSKASELAAAVPSPTGEQMVFCEDLSRFVERRVARPFVAELPTAYRRRFVVDPRSDDYQSMADREHWRFAPSEVEYRPAIRLAM